MRQLTAIGVLQLAAQWQPMGQTARLDAVLARQLRQIMRGRLTLDGGVGGDDQLADLATGQALGQHIQAQFTRAEAISWRSEEHKSELQSLMRISYAVFCLNKKNDSKP